MTEWLDRSLYPFTSRRFRVDAGNMHYVDEGPRTPRATVLVHGTPTWSFLWRHAIAHLRATGRCVAPDHLGFGLSDKPFALRPAEHAQNLATFIDGLGLRDITLAVHDFGGPIGLSYALERPENVSRIVILNTWMWGTADDPATTRLSRFIAGPIGRFLYHWLNASPRWLLPAAFAERRKLTRAIHRHYLAPFARRRDRVAPWVLGRELLASSDFYASLWARRERLRDIPIDIVWGERDPAFGARHLERFLTAFPHARVVRAASSGHFPQEEAPELVLAALSDCPERASRTSPGLLAS